MKPSLNATPLRLPGITPEPPNSSNAAHSFFERMLMHSAMTSDFSDGFDASDFVRTPEPAPMTPKPSPAAPKTPFGVGTGATYRSHWQPPVFSGNFPEALMTFDDDAVAPASIPGSASTAPHAEPKGPSLLGQFGSMLSSAWARFVSTDVDSHSNEPMNPRTLSESGTDSLRSPASDAAGVSDVVVDLATRHVSLANSKISLPGGATLGLKLDEELFSPDDTMVASDPYRRASASDWESSENQVRWGEVRGIAELGGGVNGTIPIGDLQAKGGFSSGSLIQYRTIQPVAFGSSDTESEVNASFQVGIPLDSEEYLGLSPGTEFEISGKGTLKLNASLTAGRTSGVGPARVGASASASASAHDTRDVTLNVKVLDSDGVVQVSIQDTDTRSAEVSAKLRAGLSVSGALPKDAGPGVLRHLIEANALKPFASTLSTLGSAELKAAARTENKDREVATFTLNLKSRAGQEAFEALKGLDIDEATTLSRHSDSGVWKTSRHEQTDIDTVKSSMRLGSRQLWLRERIREDRTTDFSAGGHDAVHYDASTSKLKRRDFLRGERGIQWSAIDHDTSDGSDGDVVFNLKYSAEDRYSPEGAAQRFLAFSRLLGVEYDRDPKTQEQELSSLERFFSAEDDAKVEVDLFLTNEGVTRAAGAGPELARRAFHQASSELNSAGKGLETLDAAAFARAEELAQDYANGMREIGVPDSSGDFERIRAESAYARLTGRSISEDYQELLDGKDFAEHLGSLKPDATDAERRTFFADLGESVRFGFMPVMSAITMLAGDEEVLVDSLSMKAKGVSIEGVSEGRIQHPEREIASIVSQIEARSLGTPV